MTPGKLTTLAAAAIVLIAALWTYVRGQRGPEPMRMPAAPPAAVAAAVAQNETWRRQLQTVGTLAAYRGIDVTSEVPGMVNAVHFESGQTVEQEELLVELSTDTDRARLRTIEAELEQARTDLARSVELDERNLIAAAEVEQRRTAVARLEAQAEEQRALIDKKRIVAPFAGRLGLRLVDLGEYVAPGTPLVTLQALAPIDLNFTLPEAEYRVVASGQQVQIEVAAYPHKPFNGVVTAVSPVIDEGTRNFAVQARLDNENLLLRPGMFADVTLMLPAEVSVITVPATAIAYSPAGDTAFVIQASATAEQAAPTPLTVTRVAVGPGERRGDRVAITSGLAAGDRVVTAGQLKLYEGAPVTVEPDEPRVAETAERR